jgi:hypothetical protein
MAAFPNTSALVSELNAEIGVPVEFFLFAYPSQSVVRSPMDRKITLVGDIAITRVFS